MTETKEDTEKKPPRSDKAELLRCTKEAIELRLAGGKPYEEIKDLVFRNDGITPKWKTKGGVQKAVIRSLESDVIQVAGPLVYLELERCNKYQDSVDKLLAIAEKADDIDGAVKLIRTGLKTMERRGRYVRDLEVDKVAERESFRAEVSGPTGTTLVVELAIPSKGSDAPYPYPTGDEDDIDLDTLS